MGTTFAGTNILFWSAALRSEVDGKIKSICFHDCIKNIEVEVVWQKTPAKCNANTINRYFILKSLKFWRKKQSYKVWLSLEFLLKLLCRKEKSRLIAKGSGNSNEKRNFIFPHEQFIQKTLKAVWCNVHNKSDEVGLFPKCHKMN